MPAKILDGKKLATDFILHLKGEVESLQKNLHRVPHLVNLMVGDDAGSCAYANAQKRVADQIGIQYELKNLEKSISQKEIEALIRRLNEDPDVHGIMIHKPVPSQLDYSLMANILDTAKDLEGINVTNIGKMLLGESVMIPCTPASIMELIKSTGMNLRGKEAVIVGASQIVGKPLSLLLLREEATVTICHIATSESGRLKEHISRAEILIVAVGKAQLIPGDWVRKGAIVIDVGINQKDDKIVGDIEFQEAQRMASYITPVPGGVGPMTVVMLMKNGVEAFKIQSA